MTFFVPAAATLGHKISTQRNSYFAHGSFPLRQNVLATYNSRRYDQFIRNNEEPEELMREKWLTFDYKLVLEILVEACRPRMREQCAKDFIMFLSVAIPQKFKVNADNFSRL